LLNQSLAQPESASFFALISLFSPAQNTNSALCCHLQILQPYNSLFLSFFPTAQPEWLKVISDTEADIGSNLRWGCAAAGKPRPMVRWLRNGEPLASQVGNQGFLPHDHPLLLPGPLTLLGQPRGLGTFWCFFSQRDTWPQVGHLCSITEIWDPSINQKCNLNLASRRPKGPGSPEVDLYS
jgi:hypothetical protein